MTTAPETAPETYDLTDPRTGYSSVDLVGEFAYDRSTRQLIRALGAKEHEEAFFTATIVPEPDNPHSEHGRALSVRWNNQVIGYFPESEAAGYQQLRRITASGFTATTRARLWYFVGDDRKNRVYLSLNIRVPDTLIPLNAPPTEGWTLLPDGATVQVTKEADHLDVLLDHVPPDGVGQLLVTLHEVTAGTRTTWQGVEVRLDGERIGELTKATSAKFLAAVQHFDALGLTTVARATIKGSALSAEVTLQAAKAHELTDADLEPEISPLPRLVPFRQDATAYPVPDAYIPTAGERVKTIAKRKIREIITAQEPPSATPAHEPAPSPVNAAPDPTPASSTTTRPANPFAAPRVTEPSSPAPAATSFADKAVSLLEDVPATRPGLISTVLLWIGAALGVLCVLVGVSSTGASVSYGLGMLLLGAGISLACGWPLSRRRTDQKALAAWETDNRRSAELNSLLTPEDAVIAAGLTQAPRPEKVPRQWKKVGTVAVILAVIGLACVGAGADEYAESTRTGTGSSAVSH
jgi:hypothetical protein